VGGAVVQAAADGRGDLPGGQAERGAGGQQRALQDLAGGALGGELAQAHRGAVQLGVALPHGDEFEAGQLAVERGAPVRPAADRPQRPQRPP
jgi:hypothetical protein